MPTETVTVQYVNPPKDGGSYGYIKTQDGKRISVHRDKLDLFQKGGSYVVEYETTQQGYHNFKRLAGGAGPAPAGANPRSASYTRQDDPAVAERIYCCGIVNAAVPGLTQKGLLTAGVLVQITNDARLAWRQTFGAGDLKTTAIPTPADEPPPHEEDPFAGR